MPNRAVTFASALLISSLAGVVLTASAHAAPATESNAAPAADECIAAPKTETPKGSHWYYRLEKGTKRKCWYLADQVAKAGKTASSTPVPSADPAPPRTPETRIQPSVANARAQLTTPPPQAAGSSDDATLSESIWPSPPETQTDTATSGNSQAANVQPDNSQDGSVQTPDQKNSAIASRWPEASTAGTNDNRSTAQSEALPKNTTPQPALTAANLATAAAHPNEASFGSTSMLLIMLAGALAIVAVLGRAIIKYAGYRQQARHSRNRRNIWETVPEERAPLAHESLLQQRSSHFARDLSEPDKPNDPGDEIEKLLSRVSKRAAA
jgi:hypothetical protein